jgi:hypothetical protein
MMMIEEIWPNFQIRKKKNLSLSLAGFGPSKKITNLISENFFPRLGFEPRIQDSKSHVLTTTLSGKIEVMISVVRNTT